MKVKCKECIGCGSCVNACPVNAIEFVDGVAKIDQDKCIWCATCQAVCPVDAITCDDDNDEDNKD